MQNLFIPETTPDWVQSYILKKEATDFDIRRISDVKVKCF